MCFRRISDRFTVKQLTRITWHLAYWSIIVSCFCFQNFRASLDFSALKNSLLVSIDYVRKSLVLHSDAQVNAIEIFFFHDSSFADTIALKVCKIRKMMYVTFISANCSKINHQSSWAYRSKEKEKRNSRSIHTRESSSNDAKLQSDLTVFQRFDLNSCASFS